MIEGYLKDLVAIPSHDGKEEAVACYLDKTLTGMKTHELTVHTYNDHGRSITLLPPSPAVILDAHLDTVPPGDLVNWRTPPFELADTGSSWAGLGTEDDKVNIAICLQLLQQVDCSKVGFVFAGGEETNARGLTSLFENHVVPNVQLAVALEATGLNLYTAHKGAGHIHVVVQGKAAHASRPDLGINAIEEAQLFIQAFNTAKSQHQKGHPLLGPSTMTITRISGGDAINRVPDHCQIDIDVRLVPGQNEQEIQSWLNELISGLPITAACTTELFAPAMAYSGSEELLTTLVKAGAKEISTAPFWTHAALYEEQGIPSLVFGPGDISSAHIPNECIDKLQVAKAYAILKSFIQQLS